VETEHLEQCLAGIRSLLSVAISSDNDTFSWFSPLSDSVCLLVASEGRMHRKIF
jgi:hypothetical protein